MSKKRVYRIRTGRCNYVDVNSAIFLDVEGGEIVRMYADEDCLEEDCLEEVCLEEVEEEDK